MNRIPLNPDPSLFKDCSIPLTNRNSQFYNTYPLPRNKLFAERMEMFLVKHLDEDWKFLRTDLLNLPSRYKGELRKYMVRVQAYVDSYPTVIIPPPFSKADLARGISDFEFSKKLKKLRKNSFIKSKGLRYQIMSEEIREELRLAPEIDDIGQIFNYSYCFFWEEDDEEEWKHQLIPLSYEEEVEVEYLDYAKKFFLDILDRFGDFIVIDRLKIITDVRSSVSLANNKKMIHAEVPHNLRKEFSSKPLEGLRCLVPVSPSGYRDAVILDIAQSNSVKLFEQIFSQIAEKCPYSCYFKSESKIRKAVRDLRSNNSFFFDRDIKKEGMTKPLWLVRRTIEAAKEVFPSLQELGEEEKIYDDFYLIVNNERIKTERGHGQGMANALTTVIQCIIFDIVKQYIEDIGEEFEGEPDGLFFNDDATIAFTHEEDMITYTQSEDRILTRFGIIQSKEKSHFGEDFSFCEIYSGAMNKKKSYKIAELYNPLCAVNISHAKDMLRSLYFKHSEKSLKYCIEMIYQFFGYEFYALEYENPFILGGIFSYNNKEIIIDHTKFDGSHEQKRAFKSIKRFPKPRFKRFKRKKSKRSFYKTPIGYLFPNMIDVGEWFPNLRKRISNYEFELTFDRALCPETIFNAWESLLKARRRYYDKVFPALDKKEIFSYFSEKIPFCVDISNDSNLIDIDQLEFTERKLHTSLGGLSGAIGFFSGSFDCDKFKDPRGLLNLNYSEDRIDEGLYNFLLYQKYDIDDEDDEIFLPEMFDFPDWIYSIYINPQRVVDTIYLITGELRLPYSEILPFLKDQYQRNLFNLNTKILLMDDSFEIQRNYADLAIFILDQGLPVFDDDEDLIESAIAEYKNLLRSREPQPEESQEQEGPRRDLLRSGRESYQVLLNREREQQNQNTERRNPLKTIKAFFKRLIWDDP